eukprot:XP_022264202.1 uncharacterized protein LOC102151520 [Canis lupus familiaris]
MPRLVLLQTSGFGGGPPARRAGLAAAGGAGALPRPAPASLPPRPGPGPGTCRGARVCTSPGAGGAGVGRGARAASTPPAPSLHFFFFFFFGFASRGYSRSACASDETRPAAWRALGLGPGSGHVRGLTCPEPRRRSPKSPPAPAGRGCSRRLGGGEGSGVLGGAGGCPPRPHGGAQTTCFNLDYQRARLELCAYVILQEKKKKEEKSKEHPTCQRHTHLLQPRRSPAALTSAECLQKVPHGSSAPPHRPCYTCFKEEATEVLGCWVTCLRFPSGSGVSSQELDISYYLRPWASPLSSLDSSFPVYKMVIIKFALCT